MRGTDILGLENMPRTTIEKILRTARTMEEVLDRPARKLPTLRGKNVTTLFFEPSTRTRSSFEAAAKILGADVTGFTPATSSLQKGEGLLDTARTLEAMGADCLVVRHRTAGVPRFLADRLGTPVVNAGDGMHEHPTQGLLDLYTILSAKGHIEGLRVAIVGDIEHSRVARSDLFGLLRLGAEVRLAGPTTLLPLAFPRWMDSIDRPGKAKVCKLSEALDGADAVIVLRLQRERQAGARIPSPEEYSTFWGLTVERLRQAKPDVLFLHPMPINRGLEVESAVADGPHSWVFRQVRHGVAVRMSILYLILAGGDP